MRATDRICVHETHLLVVVIPFLLSEVDLIKFGAFGTFALPDTLFDVKEMTYES